MSSFRSDLERSRLSGEEGADPAMSTAAVEEAADPTLSDVSVEAEEGADPKMSAAAVEEEEEGADPTISTDAREAEEGADPTMLTAAVEAEEEDGDEEMMEDHFDRLPDSVLLVIFNMIGDVKALGRCCVVSQRFHDLVPQVDYVLVRVDCVITDPDDPSSSSSSNPAAGADKGHTVLSSLARLVLGGIVKPLQALGQILGPSAASKRSSSSSEACSSNSSEVSHHSPTEVLKNFKEIRRLRIELPAGELGFDDGVLLKWKANFGSSLDSCVILGASSITSSASLSSSTKGSKNPNHSTLELADDTGENICSSAGGGDDNESIPDSFYTNGSLKLRVVWTISSLIAASARHYLLQSIIAEHNTLESLDLTDADGQGVLSMDRAQLGEVRVKPVSPSGSSHRTLVPALNMRLWYAPHLELSGGVVLKGATLVAIQPSDQPKESGSDGSWVSSAFEEPFGTAARLLVKRRTYCLEMNSF